MDGIKNDYNKGLNDYLTIYKVPVAPDSLDPTVFYFPENGERPRLQPGVHAQITNDIEILVSGQPSRVKQYVIVGDVVTPGNTKTNGDIKVLVVINKDLLDVDADGMLAEEVLKLSNSLSGKLAVGSTRKIRYTPMVRTPNSDNYEAIYDIPNISWIKYPSGLKVQ